MSTGKRKIKEAKIRPTFPVIYVCVYGVHVPVVVGGTVVLGVVTVVDVEGGDVVPVVDGVILLVTIVPVVTVVVGGVVVGGGVVTA